MYKTKGRNVFLGGQINENTINEAMEKITALHEKNEDEFITLYLNSDGGIIEAGFEFYEYITKILKLQKMQIVVLGRAGSAALIILLSVEHGHRYMCENSYLFFHNASHVYEKDTEVQIAEQKRGAENLEWLNERYKKIVLARTDKKLPKKKLKNLMNGYEYIYPEEAIELGLVCQVLK